MVVRCQCCGQEIADFDLEAALFRLRLSGTQETIVRTLFQRRDIFVKAGQLADAVYANDINGGPEDPESVIRSTVFHLRKRLKAVGLTIGSRFGPPGGYRLEWTASPDGRPPAGGYPASEASP